MTEATQSAPAPRGIGGWLILPIVHLGLNAILIALNAATGIAEGYGLIAPAGGAPPLPHDLNLALLTMSWFEAGLLAYAGLCAVQFARARKQVPYLMIGFYVLLLTMTIAEYFFADAVKTSPESLSEPIRAAVRTAIAAAVWIPYFLVSKRVKNTFVR